MANRIWALVLTPLLVAELLQVTPSGLSVEPPFATVAEGFTSESERDGVQVAFRMFSLPDFETCAATPKPSRLIAITTPIEIRLGEPFALSRIVVVARDSRGSLLRQVPIALEVEDIGLFNLRSNAIAESKLEPLRPGRLRFRARTVCPGISISTVIPATIW